MERDRSSQGALALVGAAALFTLPACLEPEPESAYVWALLPAGVPPPPTPADNPQTAEKVELGRYLFYDTQLSLEDNRACGVCHEQAKGFTDSFPRAVGTTGELHLRNTPSLTNVAYFEALSWVDPEPVALETQLLSPLLGSHPIVEMGMGGREQELLDRLRPRPEYQKLFPLAFPDDEDPFTIANLARAIAAFERTLLSWNSPYDRWQRGELAALEPAAERGRALFFGEAGCSRCHDGPNFNSPSDASGAVLEAHGSYNVGLYDVDGEGAYPEGHEGLLSVSGEPSDMGKHRTPSLRNASYTRPYMHDGSVDTLEHAVRIMAEGGRLVDSGPNLGDGRASPLKDEAMVDLGLDDAQLGDLVAFIGALDDEAFITSDAIASPYPPFIPVPP